MNKNLQNQLFAKYPKIFRDAHLSPRQSCMGLGIECGDGWYQIIDALCAALSSGYSSSKDTMRLDGIEGRFPYDTTESSQVVVTQIKEKFSTLRFYTYDESSKGFEELCAKYPKTGESIMDEISSYRRGMIWMAESLSAITCEETGKPGKVCKRGGWLKTLCEEKAKELGFEWDDSCDGNG